MAKYINTTTQEVSTDSQIKKLHNNVSFSKVVDTFADLGYAPIFQTPPPEITELQTARKSGVTQDANGNWVDAWIISDLSQEELDARSAQRGVVARVTRNQALSASDWTQVADAPVDQAAWAAYRQALRDVPSQAEFPEDIIWPTEP